jgi:hypothetical protein
MMSILLGVRGDRCGVLWETYSVVALRVKVKLIENKWKSHEGKDIVANVMNQYITVGIILKKKNTIFPNRPSQVLEVDGSTRPAVGLVVREVAAELIELTELDRISDMVTCEEWFWKW